MTMVIPNPSELNMLLTLFGQAPVEDLVCQLFVNNQTPGVADTLANYTEMTGLGYTSMPVARTSWSIVTDSTTNRAVATFPQINWTFQNGTATTVFGYYVTRASTGDLWYAERFATSHIVQNLGDKILLTLVMALSQ